MPIYEFRCNACNRTVSVFQRSISTAVAARCSHCGAEDLTRLVSAFAFHRSASYDDFDGAGDDFDEELPDDVDENDPRSMARWARRMSDELGQDMGPEFDETIRRMEAGEMPDDSDVGGGDDDLGDL
ncbi:MAG: zinc ribbon domain-containing protein [Dehalococcoidia bacterium]